MNTGQAVTSHHMPAWEVIGILLAILILFGVLKFIKAFVKTLEKELMFVLVWRFLSGAHLHGERRTDAGWWSHGTDTKRHAFERDTFMDNWEHKPRGHRMLWRLGILSALIGLVYGLVTEFTLTRNAVMSLAVYGLVVAGFVIHRKVTWRVHDRQLRNPMSKSIANYVRIFSPHAVKKMLHLDPANINSPTPGYFGPLPDHFTPSVDMQSGIERIIDVHMPIEIEMDWKMDQSPRIGEIVAAKKPPDQVSWSEPEIQAEMAKCRMGEVILGRDHRKELYRASLTDLDDPHWGMDVNTGYGKSNFLGIVAVQVLHQDPQAQAFVFDVKGASVLDFLGDIDDPDKPLLKGVTMCNHVNDPDEMWRGIQQARKVMERRAEKWKKDRRRKFPCALILIDELGQWADVMNEFWERMKFEDSRLAREDRAGLKGRWPGWDDLTAIIRMARFVNMHVIACAQDFRDDAFGGKGARNILGFKGMAGYNTTKWDKFMQTKPVPVMQDVIGRFRFSNGNQKKDTWVQTVYADAERDRAAYEYAAEGRDAFVDNDGDAPDVTMGDDAQAALASVEPETAASRYLFSIGHKTDIHPVDVTQGDQRRVICGEREAAEFLGYKISAFRQARYRASLDDGPGIPGEFKKGRTPCWYEDDLLAWKVSLPGTGRKKARLRLVKDDDASL